MGFMKRTIGGGYLAGCAVVLAVGLMSTNAALAQGGQHDSHDNRDNRDNRSNKDNSYHSVRDDRERSARRDDTHRDFTHSTEGRHFENGVELRRAMPYEGRPGFDRRPGELGDRRLNGFRPLHEYAYPHYFFARPSGVSVVISPFSFYVGVCPPFIARTAVIFAPPPIVYVSAPVYVDGVYSGYPGYSDGYYLSRPGEDGRWRQNTALKQSVYNLEDAFLDDDITLLAQLTDPGTKIAVFSKGKYQYSLEPNDYLDMTRDFMRSADTSDFSVYRVRRRTAGVYQVFAKHTYQDGDGETRSVFLCIVMDNSTGKWTITQVDTSPDRIEG